MGRKLQKQEPRRPGYAMSPLDACDEGAARLRALIQILHVHDCLDGDRMTEEGGYDIAIVAEGLIAISNMLEQASRDASAPRGTGAVPR